MSTFTVTHQRITTRVTTVLFEIDAADLDAAIAISDNMSIGDEPAEVARLKVKVSDVPSDYSVSEVS